MAQDNQLVNNLLQHEENRLKAIAETIEELKQKISLTERKHMLDIDKMSGLISKNENTIILLRTKNASNRSVMRSAFQNDKLLLHNTFKGHGKHIALLAVKDKPAEEVIMEVDQSVCDLARKMNALVHQGQKKKREFIRVAKRLEEAGKVQAIIPKQLDELSALRQLENSLDKVKLKKTTAKHINNVYVKIKSQVEADLRTYPERLTMLERGLLAQKHEMKQLTEMEKCAHHETELALIAKNSCERQVREDRKKRELNLKQLKQKVRLISQQEVVHPATRRNLRHDQDQQHHQSDTIAAAARIERILDKIKDYKYKAEMLESVTGIPFVSSETMINSLKNQKNSSDVLSRKSKQKVLEMKRLKEELKRGSEELHELMYNEEWRISQQINAKEELLNEKCDETTRLRSLLKKQMNNMFHVEEYLSSIALYLKQASVTLPSLAFNNNIKGGDSLTVFNEVVRVFFLLYDMVSKRLNHTDHTSQFQIPDLLIRKRDINKLIPAQNNRIKCQIERRVSEEFGEFNQPTNDKYLSRDMIKAHAGNKHKGK